MKDHSNLDMNDVPGRMSVSIEKMESPEDAALRRFKDKYTFIAYMTAAILGLAVSLYFIVTNHTAESQKFSWSAFTGILGLIIGRQARR